MLPGLSGLHSVRTEVNYGEERSRIDVLALDAQGKQVYIEVKNTTLRRGSDCCFPDAVTERGAKHLRELRCMAGLGHRSAIVYFVQRTDVEFFNAAADIDPRYAEELQRAAQAGVTVLPQRVDLQASKGSDGRWSLAWSLPGLLPWNDRPGGPGRL